MGVEYTLYEGHRGANESSRKLGVFDRKLEGKDSTFLLLF